MPTIITRGLGYDAPTIIITKIASELSGELVVEERLLATLEMLEDEVPVATITMPIPIVGSIVEEDALVGEIHTTDELVGTIQEEGPPMTTDTRLVMFLRDDRTLSLTVNVPDSTAPSGVLPVDLTGSKVWFTVKTRTSDADDVAIIQKRNTAAGGGDTEIKLTDAVNGKAEIYIVPADTATDVDPGIYVWDVQVTLANDKTYTALRGRITFKEDITKASA